MQYALVGRRGDTGRRYRATQAHAMYETGVALAMGGDMLQVWRATDSGDLLGYDGPRTRKLTDKIVATRQAKNRAMRCDSCEMLSINGVACHETGCPNARSRWDAESGAWVKQRKCRECGQTVDADDMCCDAPCED